MHIQFKKIGLRILILIGTLVILFDVSEAIVRAVKPQITYSDAMKFSDNYLAADPTIPFTLQKNYSGIMHNYYGDFETKITTNSLGYRGAEFLPDKPVGTKRILVLGDSVTFGVGVTDDQTYPALMQHMFQSRYHGLDVVNAGYADGFSPDSYYVYLKNRGLALKPDAIVVGFFVWNDITDLSETVWAATDAAGLPTAITSCCRVVDNGVLRNINIPFKYRYPWLRESNVFLLLTNTLEQRFGLFKPPAQLVPKRDYFQGCIFSPACIGNFSTEEGKDYRVLSAMKKLADSRGIPFYVVLFPVDVQLYPDAAVKYGLMPWTPDSANPEFIQKRIEDNLTNLGIGYFDLYPVFDQGRERGYPFFVHDAHMNPLGNQMAAEAISGFLTDRLNFLH